MIKILGRGELKAKLDVKAHAFSDSAVKAIEAQGGVATKNLISNETTNPDN